MVMALGVPSWLEVKALLPCPLVSAGSFSIFAWPPESPQAAVVASNQAAPRMSKRKDLE